MSQCQIREDPSPGCYNFVQLQQHLGVWHPCYVHSVRYSSFICFWLAKNPAELQDRLILYERWQDICYILSATAVQAACSWHSISKLQWQKITNDLQQTQSIPSQHLQ